MKDFEKTLFSDIVEVPPRDLVVGIGAVLASGHKVLEQRSNVTAERNGFEFKAEVDKLANNVGIKVIKEAFPNDTILTEEQRIPGKQKKRVWVCDFLDGTTNFLNGSRNYSILLAFVENGIIKTGISYIPETKELFYAVKGLGSFLNNEKIEVSSVDSLQKSSVCLDPGYLLNGAEKISSVYQSLRPYVGNISMFNANGYSLAMLAKGETAGFVHFFSKVWECAGLLIAEEAGAKITDFSGKPINLNFSSDSGFEFVASNGRIHDELLTHLR